MKKLLIILFFVLSVTIFAENKISITASSDIVTAKIALNESEYIILNDQFLFLFIESAHYNFTFNGYPDGELQDNGDIYYSKELKLSGSLELKDGVPPGDYEINVVLGFQTCDKAGICNIPVEVSEEIMVRSYTPSLIPLVLLLTIISTLVSALLYRKKRKS